MKMKTKFFYLFLVALFSLSIIACNNDDEENEDDNNNDTNPNWIVEGSTVTIKDDGNGIGTKTLHADTTYILDGFVFVNDGQTLTIEAGTMIQGLPGEGENASALIVANGGTIMAEGTESEPIVFTAYNDNYSGDAYNKTTRGLWGGLIVLGNATTNEPVDAMQIEGIPKTEPRGAYGSSNPDDSHSSGTLKYIQLRHGGTDIGAGNEINGLSMGAVGNGTTIEYIEVIANKDDGLEFFGGSVNTSHILVSYCGDDSYDYDQGFHGKGQFWVAIQDDSEYGRCGEHDGGHEDETAQPYGAPTIYNATYIGGGEGTMITFRDNAGGIYANSIFVAASDGIEVEYRGDKDNCSAKMFINGNLELKNNVFYNVAGDSVSTTTAEAGAFTYYVEEDDQGNPLNDGLPSDMAQQLADHFNNNSNIFEDLGVSSENVLPTATGSNGTASVPSDSFFEDISYHGAFESGNNWAANWTLTFK